MSDSINREKVLEIIHDVMASPTRSMLEDSLSELPNMIRSLPSCDTSEKRYFRWCYRAIIALAIRCMKDKDTFHGGKVEWNELVGSSHSMYLRKAREEAGIPHDKFLEIIRSLEIDVDDIYEMADNGIPLPMDDD